MKKIAQLFKKEKKRTIENCIELKINNEESDEIYGGFKEYVPPIYEHEIPSTKKSLKVTDLLSGIFSNH